MNIGKLRHKIIIQKGDAENRISDGQGGFTESWVDVANIWAEIGTINGKEIYKAMEFDTVITHRIRTRYIKGIDPKMRIAYGKNDDGTPKRIFRIINAVDVDERHKELEILCVELVD